MYEGDGKSRLGGNIVCLFLFFAQDGLGCCRCRWGWGCVGLGLDFRVLVVGEREGRESRGLRIVRGDGKRRRASEKLDRCRTASLRARCRWSYSLLQQLQLRLRLRLRLRYGWADCRAVHEAAASGPRECAVPSQDRDSRLPVNLMGGRTFG